MVSHALSNVVEAGLGLWFAALAVLIAIQLFRGKIVTAGLLSPGAGGGSGVTRIQLLLATATFAVGYIGAALAQQPGSNLPNVPGAMLIALFGSHGFYLGGKYRAGRS